MSQPARIITSVGNSRRPVSLPPALRRELIEKLAALLVADLEREQSRERPA